jgi:hypothetical protein
LKYNWGEKVEPLVAAGDRVYTCNAMLPRLPVFCLARGGEVGSAYYVRDIFISEVGSLRYVNDIFLGSLTFNYLGERLYYDA